jgi:anti-sigma B factor antagonist
MISTDLSIRGCHGHVVVTLRGEPDRADATFVTAALTAIADRQPEIVVDLTGLEFIDTIGVAALARGSKHARRAGSDLLLAAPQAQVMRVLTITRQADDFSVYVNAEEAVSSIAGSPRSGRPGGAAVA